jgi:hypothetical protein
MWSRVDLAWTKVSEERTASIFRVEKSASEEPAWAGGCRSAVFTYPPMNTKTTAVKSKPEDLDQQNNNKEQH